MSRECRVSPATDADLDEQAAYLAAHASVEVALRFYEAADRAFRSLASTPGIGERWPTSHPRLAKLRVWPIEEFPNHLIFYQPIEAGIEVVRVLHEARDVESVLRLERPG